MHYRIIFPQFPGDAFYLMQRYGMQETLIAKRDTEKEIIELKGAYMKRDRKEILGY